MTRITNRFGTHSGSLRLRAAALAILASLLVGRPLRAEDPAAESEPESELRFVRHVGKLYEEKLKVRSNWMADDASTLSPVANVVLRVATDEKLTRKRLKKEIVAAGETYKSIARNLDVGRHQLVKNLIAKAVTEANVRLAQKNMTLIDRVTTVNSGGTGDYTRDVDMSVFAMDDAREIVLFESLRDIARGMGLTVEVDGRLGVKAGINIPQIEVALHRGANDVPDARYASDPHAFALDYRRAIELQSRNPEAYFGYGFEMEVQGRRSLSFKPGQTLVQDFVPIQGGGVSYRGQIAACQREVRGILRGTIGQRYRRAQSAVHMANNYLQAFRHEAHAGESHGPVEAGDENPNDPSKGALKYAGRSLEQLCEYHGMRNWSELVPEDRIQLLTHIFPPGYIDEPGGRQRLERMAASMDVAYLTFLGKAVPKQSGGNAVSSEATDEHSQIALIFLRKSAAACAGSVAREMLDPPALDPRFLAQVNEADGKWQRMNADERDREARLRDANYKKCVSIAAMENLLALVHQIKLLDLPEYNKRGTAPGRDAMRQMLEQADPKIRPLLALAEEHSDAAIAQERAQDPASRDEATRRMEAVRAKLAGHLPGGAPGDDILRRAAATTAKDFVQDRKKQKPGFWGQATDEMRVRMNERLDEAFPPADLAGFRAMLKEKGVGEYVAHRLVAEAISPGNIVDGLQLIEMYQNSASLKDYGWFLTTNVLGRVHSALGFVVQAASVKTGQDVRELGKYVVFDVCARLIPGVGTVKIFFDIERGIVNVTVGWALNQANAALIDALYTGEAGRTSEIAAGTVGGRIRDSGICVLDPKFVRKSTDAKSGKVTVDVDRVALYLDRFQAWSVTPGRTVDHEDIGSRTPVGGSAGKFLRAHDALVRAILAQGETEEQGWFGSAWSSASAKAAASEMESAMGAYRDVVTELCRPISQNVLNELAPREYYRDGQDQIAEGLHQRLVADVMFGTVQAWQTHQLERVLAKREVQRTAALVDLGGLAKAVAESTPSGGSRTYEIEVGVNHPIIADGLAADRAATLFETVFDANEPVPLSCVLICKGPAPLDAPDVAFEVEPTNFERTEKRDGPLVAGEVVKQHVIVKALSGSGTEIARRELTLLVRLPDDLLTRLKAAKRIDVTYSGPARTTRTDSGGGSGLGTSVGQGGGTVSIDPIDATRTDHYVKMSWSGNQFTADLDRESAYTQGDTTGTGHVIGRVTGTVDVKRQLVTVEASVRETSSSADSSGHTTSFSYTCSLGARNVPFSGTNDVDIVFALVGTAPLRRGAPHFSRARDESNANAGTEPRLSHEDSSLADDPSWTGEVAFRVTFSKTSYQEFVDDLLKNK
ncbi:MAG: hypothetical protein K8T90_18780 [Planctomycetes bacterium]|nr:hypothetical protein [Planctomycetota bacterium]